MSHSGTSGSVFSRYFGEGWFAVFMLSTVLFWHILLVGLLLVPASESSFGEFAEDFRRRCLEYGTTGSYNWAFIIPMITAPFVIGSATFLAYRQSLRRAVRHPATLIGWGSAGLALACFGGLQLYMFGVAALERASEFALPLEFPADKLRTKHPPPLFTLTNQDGVKVSPQDYTGKVVVLTAVFARCAYTCPMIMAQAKRAVAQLTEEEQAEVVFMGVTLDPENESVASMGALASSQGVSTPQFHLLSGPPASVNPVLDHMGVMRKWNDELKTIDHTNLFLVLDREGMVAYRFSLGERQEAWLIEALRLVLAEPTEPSP